MRARLRFFLPLLPSRLSLSSLPSSSLRFAFAVLLLAVAMPRASHAQASLFGNLPNTSTFFELTLLSRNSQESLAFTTGASFSRLTSVQAELAAVGDPFAVSFSLYTASVTNNNDPGIKIADIGTQTVSSDKTYTFTPPSSSSPIILANNTRYVLLLDFASSAPAGGLLDWFSNESPAPVARNGSGFSNPVYRVSNNNGASYSNTTLNNLISINGTLTAAMPEPGSLTLAGMGAIPLVGGVMRRRRK